MSTYISQKIEGCDVEDDKSNHLNNFTVLVTINLLIGTDYVLTEFKRYHTDLNTFFYQILLRIALLQASGSMEEEYRNS